MSVPAEVTGATTPTGSSDEPTDREFRRMVLLQQRATRRSAQIHVNDLDLVLRLASVRDVTRRIAPDGPHPT